MHSCTHYRANKQTSPGVAILHHRLGGAFGTTVVTRVVRSSKEVFGLRGMSSGECCRCRISLIMKRLISFVA